MATRWKGCTTTRTKPWRTRFCERSPEEAAARLETDRLSVVHRTGDLDVGEVSVAVAVSSPHRAEAYDASRYVIEEIKKRLPIWKKEHYTGGDAAWVEGTVPPGTGPAAASEGLS
ncbi:MAG: molybdenum cofactor biosynthesis protein MoaE [Gemmatimonadota bacterium]|nr:molybdenum cofactor biosynthesis protein MoaE [Gemmatimonadota bacterium]